MKQKLDEEGNKCSILSKQERFNERCCMRCCSPFTFLINTKRQCQDCKYNICKNCSSYQKKEKSWLCNVCEQARWVHAVLLLMTRVDTIFFWSFSSRDAMNADDEAEMLWYMQHSKESSIFSVACSLFCFGVVDFTSYKNICLLFYHSHDALINQCHNALEKHKTQYSRGKVNSYDKMKDQ